MAESSSPAGSDPNPTVQVRKEETPMLCPRCGSINKDTARQCRECGVRLTNVRISPEARKTESKYLLSGIIAFVGIVLVLVLLISSVCCIAGRSGCISCGGDENYINENVDGEWDNIAVSPSDEVSYTDAEADSSTAEGGTDEAAQ